MRIKLTIDGQPHNFDCNKFELEADFGENKAVVRGGDDSIRLLSNDVEVHSIDYRQLELFQK